MKKKYLYIEFIAVLLFLVIPPLTVNSGTPLSLESSISFTMLAQLLICIVLQTQHYFLLSDTNNKEFLLNKKEKQKKINYLLWAAITFLLLALSFIFVNLAVFVCKSLSQNQINQDLSFKIPDSFYKWFTFLFTLILASFYEEILYRQFLINGLLNIYTFNRKKIYAKVMEVLAVSLFALSHRYLGVLPVINAFICGAALRLCYKKTKSVYTGAAVHFLYNFLMFIFNFSATNNV